MGTKYSFWSFIFVRHNLDKIFFLNCEYTVSQSIKKFNFRLFESWSYTIDRNVGMQSTALIINNKLYNERNN